MLKLTMVSRFLTINESGIDIAGLSIPKEQINNLLCFWLFAKTLYDLCEECQKFLL